MINMPNVYTGVYAKVYSIFQYLYGITAWDTIIRHAALHCGKSDSIAAICCAWYGAMFGFAHVPQINYANLEYKDRLYRLGHALHDKSVNNSS